MKEILLKIFMSMFLLLIYHYSLSAQSSRDSINNAYLNSLQNYIYDDSNLNKIDSLQKVIEKDERIFSKAALLLRLDIQKNRV